jgi:SAM-dependent methyltransferase
MLSKWRNWEMSATGIAADRFWEKFRHSRLLHEIRQIGIVSLVLELRATLREPVTSSPRAVSRDFAKSKDPWNYETNPIERQRFQDQTRLIDTIRNGNVFRSGLEIGCAGGHYTEVLGDLCESLLALDISPLALDLARQRLRWSNRIRFETFDLRVDDIPGTFDLIVIAGVLEYFNRLETFVRVRDKIVNALNPGGYLLVETTRRPRLENTWWGRHMIRGRWINRFVAQHPSLYQSAVLDSDFYAIGLYRRTLS